MSSMLLGAAGGAADGLEALYARIRAQEMLANQTRGVDNQSRSLDLTERNIGVNEREGLETTDYRNRSLAHQGRELDSLIPGRTAAAESQVNQNNIIKGLLPILGGDGGAANAPSPELPVSTLGPASAGDASATPGAVGSGAASTGGVPGPAGNGVTGLNNPSGRLRLRLAGVPANDIFGAVDTPSSEWEVTADAYARKLGKRSRHDLTFEEIQTAGQDPLADDRLKMALDRLNLSRDRLGFDRDKDTFGRTMAEQRLSIAQARLANDLPAPLATMAGTEFADRVKREIGQDDPPEKYDLIRNQVAAKYRAMNPNAGAAGGSGAPGAPARRRYDINGNLIP